MIELVAPAERYRASVLAAEAESVAEGGGHGITDENFSATLARLADNAAGRNLKPRRVAETTLWLVDGDDYIGRIALRHALTPLLVVLGGHIGYDVRPSRRRQGHATQMLRLAMPRMAALGVDPALITCDDTNLASRKVIEACGGTLATDEADVAAALAYVGDDATAREMLAVPQLRFWLPTAQR
ncbi:MAG TPA: GNAT family N-acetyltransferase [Kofleriaceae bacterium]